VLLRQIAFCQVARDFPSRHNTKKTQQKNTDDLDTETQKKEKEIEKRKKQTRNVTAERTSRAT
jgi:hypothetical protein